MPTFTNKHKATIYELFGIPRITVNKVITRFGLTTATITEVVSPSVAEGTHALVATALEAQITAIEAMTDNATFDRIKQTLCTYDEIRDSQTLLTEARNSKGIVVDHRRQINRLRQLVGDLMGFSVPFGGFSKDIKRAYEEGTGIGDR